MYDTRTFLFVFSWRWIDRSTHVGLLCLHYRKSLVFNRTINGEFFLYFYLVRRRKKNDYLFVPCRRSTIWWYPYLKLERSLTKFQCVQIGIFVMFCFLIYIYILSASVSNEWTYKQNKIHLSKKNKIPQEHLTLLFILFNFFFLFLFLWLLQIS